CLGHAVNIFLLLHRGATAIGSIEQLGRQFLHHALLTTCAAIGNEPANRQRGATLRKDFNRNLIVRATNAATLYFEQRLAVLDGLLEELEGLVATLLLQISHGGIEDALCG